MDSKLTTSCTIHLIVNRSRVKNDGTVRLYIAIRVEKEEPIKIKLPLFWPIEYYDLKTHSITSRYPDDKDHLAFTSIIETEKAKYWRVVKKFYLLDKAFTSSDIMQGVNTLSMGSKLSAYITARSKARQKGKDKDIKPHTGDNHRAGANKILEYISKDIEIVDVGKPWLDKYLKWLLIDLEYGGAWAHMKTVMTYLRDAKRRGITTNDTFEEFRMDKPDSNAVWLERDELQKLLTLYNDPFISTENKNCLKAFLFDCFTGLRISDLKRFKKDWIVNNEIVFSPIKGRLTQKKPQIINIPIIPVAEQFIFGLNEGGLVQNSEQNNNKKLKVIAALAGIDKKLTWHVARHTFGTLLAINGTAVIIIAKLLGHKKIESAMIYIHIAEKIRQFEMSRLQETFEMFKVHRNVG